MVIHPSQIPIVNEVFSPSEEDISDWRRIVEAMGQAEAAGRGAIRLDGRLIDAAHVATARQQLERAARLGLFDEQGR